MNVYTIKGECGLSNTYLLWKDEGDVIIIDPSDSRRLKDCILERSNKVCYTFLTHEHWDHIIGLNDLRDMGNVKVISTKRCSEAIQSSKLNLSKYMSFFVQENLSYPFACDASDIIFEGMGHIEISGIEINLFETPGHSPGSCCIQIESMLFSGDSILGNLKDIFCMPRHNMEAYRKVTFPMLKQLYSCDKNIIVYPGHGEKSSLGNMIKRLEKYLEVKK